jgi:hypothetical protein
MTPFTLNWKVKGGDLERKIRFMNKNDFSKIFCKKRRNKENVDKFRFLHRTTSFPAKAINKI